MREGEYGNMQVLCGREKLVLLRRRKFEVIL